MENINFIGKISGSILRASLWLILLFILPLTWNIDWPTAFWVKQAGFFIFLLFADTINARVLVPRYLYSNKIWQYVLLVLLCVLLILFLSLCIENLLSLDEKMHYIFRPDKPYKPEGFRIRFDMQAFLITLLVFGLSTIITLVKKWQKDTEIKQELEREKINSELTYLKAQINPHFFFNTLNSIYALTSVNVDLAQQAIHKLSRMMRYMLYETQNDTTFLSQELNFIQDYIELMKLRLLDKVKVEFHQSIQNTELMIAPMLFLPFVENAFKHGVSAQQDSHIFINFEQEGAAIKMVLKNSLFKNKKANIIENSGIGLTNTKRRLELLYPNKHQIEVEKDVHEYRVTMKIQLS